MVSPKIEGVEDSDSVSGICSVVGVHALSVFGSGVPNATLLPAMVSSLFSFLIWNGCMSDLEPLADAAPFPCFLLLHLMKDKITSPTISSEETTQMGMTILRRFELSWRAASPTGVGTDAGTVDIVRAVLWSRRLEERDG